MIDTSTPAPGPWRMPNDTERRCRVYFEHPFRDCVDVCEVNPDLEEMTDATMRQIAAAPDLARELAHLVRLLEPLEHSGELNIPGFSTLNGARKALAKLKESP